MCIYVNDEVISQNELFYRKSVHMIVVKVHENIYWGVKILKDVDISKS
jgi:hypothetical protein